VLERHEVEPRTLRHLRELDHARRVGRRGGEERPELDLVTVVHGAALPSCDVRRGRAPSSALTMGDARTFPTAGTRGARGQRDVLTGRAAGRQAAAPRGLATASRIATRSTR